MNSYKPKAAAKRQHSGSKSNAKMDLELLELEGFGSVATTASSFRFLLVSGKHTDAKSRESSGTAAVQR